MTLKGIVGRFGARGNKNRNIWPVEYARLKPRAFYARDAEDELRLEAVATCSQEAIPDSGQSQIE